MISEQQIHLKHRETSLPRLCVARCDWRAIVRSGRQGGTFREVSQSTVGCSTLEKRGSRLGKLARPRRNGHLARSRLDHDLSRCRTECPLAGGTRQRVLRPVGGARPAVYTLWPQRKGIGRLLRRGNRKAL